MAADDRTQSGQPQNAPRGAQQPDTEEMRGAGAADAALDELNQVAETAKTAVTELVGFVSEDAAKAAGHVSVGAVREAAQLIEQGIERLRRIKDSAKELI